MSKGIFIFDENLIKKGVIYGYEEFRIKQQLVNAGDFTITIATEKNGVDLLVENSIIYATPNLSGVILEVENYQKKTGNYTIIKGKTLNALLGYRIVHNFTLESNTESIAKTLVDENLVNSSDSNRNIPMSIETNNNNGSTQEINANKQVLSNVLEEVLSVDNYGHKVYLENEQLKYDVIIPNNTSVQFSNKIYNLNEATQIKSQSGYRNVAYIDNGDTMFEYGNETGINRREIILTDKRITSPITAGYKAQQELSSKHYKTESIQGKIRIIGNPFKYGEDYSLGDYVTVVYRDVVYTVQVTEVEQIFSGNNGYELYLYFGKPMRSVSKKIQDIQTKAEKTDVIEAELVSSVETIETALEGKSDTTHNHNLNDLSEKNYNSLTNKPTSLPANGGNADTVDGKHASAFADSNHNHNLNNLAEKSYNSLTNKPTSLPANGGNADTVDGKHASAFANAVHSHAYLPVNSPSVGVKAVDVRGLEDGDNNFETTPVDMPDSQVSSHFGYVSGAGSFWRGLLSVKGFRGNYSVWQLIGNATTSADDDLYFRSGVGTSWRTPKRIYHSGNITSGTANPSGGSDGDIYLQYE